MVNTTTFSHSYFLSLSPLPLSLPTPLPLPRNCRRRRQIETAMHLSEPWVIFSLYQEDLTLNTTTFSHFYFLSLSPLPSPLPTLFPAFVPLIIIKPNKTKRTFIFNFCFLCYFGPKPHSIHIWQTSKQRARTFFFNIVLFLAMKRGYSESPSASIGPP